MSRSSSVRWSAVAATAALFGIAGCGGSGFDSGSEGGGKGGDTGEIRMLVNITPNLTKQFWEELVQPFEDSHPGVTVKIETPATAVKDTLPQLLAAGNPPDVVETLQADETLAPQMLDLTDQAWVSETPLAEEAKVGGKVYSVGVGVQAQSLVYYNKDAFAKAGITTPPKTLDELDAAMAKLKAAGYLPLQTAGSYVTGLQFLQLADPSLFTTNPTWYQDVASKKTTPGATFTPLLQRYASWISKGYVDKNALGLDDTTGPANFFKGKSAMYVMGSWFVKTADDAKPTFPLGAFAAPPESGQPSPGPQGVSIAAPYMVLKATKNRDLSTQLVQWLVTDTGAVQKQLRQDGNFREGFGEGLSPLGQEVQSILDAAPAQVPHSEGFGSNRVPKGFNSEWNKQVQSLYTGAKPADAAKAIDTWLASQK